MKNSYINLKNHVCTISQSSLFFFLFVLAFCPVLGQVGQTKPVVQPKDYALWHTLRFPQISGDGQWTSYQLAYEHQQDTLTVMNINGTLKYDLPAAHQGQFQPSNKPSIFAFNDDTNGIGILDLKTGKKEWVKDAEQFDFSANGKYLACYSLRNHSGYLKLFDIGKHQETVINNVQNFRFDPLGRSAVIFTNDGIQTKVELLRLPEMRRSVVLSGEGSEFLYPTWNVKGSALAFLESTEDEKQRIYYFENTELPILKEIDGIDLKGFGGLEISKLELSFSEDGERIFFWTHQKEVTVKESANDTVKVEVWKGTDKWIYPRQKLDWEYDKKHWLAVWWTKSKKVFQIGNPERPEVQLNGDQKFALSYNLLTYEPQNQQYPQSDFYITNLDTGETTLLLKKMETILGQIEMSPNGEKIAYFKDHNWWIYNILKNEHINVTNNIPFPLNYKHAEYSLYIVPFGIDWTTEGDLLVYDEFDVWKVSDSGEKPQRLTNGRERSISYRCYNNLYDGFYNFITARQNTNIYNLEEDIIFTTRDAAFNSGFAIRNRNGNVRPLVSETGKISELHKAKYAKIYIFLSEKNNMPPALFKTRNNSTKVLVQSNSQQNKFAIGKTELISYKNVEGEQLHGLLHYPDEYKIGMKYPMIVHIYQLLSDQYQNYTNPTYYTDDGFNYRNFTASGYFVLEPDIQVQKGKPGISVLDCVEKAVNIVLKKDLVRRDAIGLIGHSFGGYGTAFIISKTNLFAAAVIGAGIFDIVSAYHTIEDWGRTPHWRFENQQWRFGISFYENMEMYKRNSPLEYTNHIKTPTLIWAGNKDYQVNWHQSEAMYLALRRLKKEVQLLIYENEPHSLVQPKNQKDLTGRIQKWFDTYLKTPVE